MTRPGPGIAHYIIRGGIEGRERLRILSRVMRSSTLQLLQLAGTAPGMACVDVGCGGGDVAFDLARLVGPSGRVVALDVDKIKIESARREAAAMQLTNVDFRVADIDDVSLEAEFDLAHARFLLSHLRGPERALLKMRQALRPGKMLVIADTDFRGHFCDPDSRAFRRYVELYTETVHRRGGDACIGRRLPRLLSESGFERVQMNVVQPAGMDDDVKLIAPLTLEYIADAVVSEGLATETEIAQLVAELYEFANAPGTMMSAAPVVQAWGVRS